MVEGAGVGLAIVSAILILINLLATFQGEPARVCGDFSNQVVKHVNTCGSTATVEANQYWNNSGLLIEKDVKYRVEIEVNSAWMDWNQPASAIGWKTAESGFTKLLRKTFARDTNNGLFYLMGAIHGKCEDGRACGYQFTIGNGIEFTADASGEFCTFANDLPFMYWNNEGAIKINILRVSDEPCELQ